MKDIKRQVTAALGDMRTVVFTRRKFDLLVRPTRDRIATKSKDGGNGDDGETECALAAAAPTKVDRWICQPSRRSGVRWTRSIA